MKSSNSKTTLFMLGTIILMMACNIPTSSEISSYESTAEPIIPVSGSTTGVPVQHVIIPADLPQERSSHAGDYDSSTTAEARHAAGGDRFTFGKFERPFNANTMDVYFPELDIVDTFVFQDETWIFGTMQVKGPDSSGAFSGKYAIELDLDRDGKGDWLITASAPTSKDWTTDGVQVFQDTNKNVGGQSPMYSDANPSEDGFDASIFDQGKGADVDSAWARISSTELNTIQIAVKRSILGDPDKYLISMWAGHSLLDPALFDLNDHFTHEQAGAADPGLEIYYPIKAVSEIDNSCRMAVGFPPTGQEPGICEVFIPNAPGASCSPTSSQLSYCSQINGSWNNSSCKCDPPPPIP